MNVMTTLLSVSTPSDAATRTAAVRSSDRLVLREIRWWHRLLSRVLADRLDGLLASGEAERTWLRAVRASELVRPEYRCRLADDWLRVLQRVESGSALSAAVMPRGANTLLARTVIIDLADGLRSPGPVSARGVAMAVHLLTDGTGPLYFPRTPADLPEAVRAVIGALERPG